MKRFLLALSMLFSACSHDNTDAALQSDYRPSLFEYQRGRVDMALVRFPDRESGGFITTLEKGWIGLIKGRVDEKPLLAFGQDLEKLQSLDVSDVLVSTFYKEKIDNYYPAEHEAVILHLTAAMILMNKGAEDKARVELRRAARFLEAKFGQNRKSGDSPSLRVWLAALWYALGDYEAAHVDIRRAIAMEPKEAWLKNLLIPKGQPVNLQIVFSGSGPTLAWRPLEGEAANPIANLRFVPSVGEKKLQIGNVELTQNLDTRDWYEHHQQKNQKLAYALRNTAYLGKGAAVGTAAGLNTFGAIVLGMTVATGGIGAGVATAVAVGGEGGISAGIVIAYTGIKAASNLTDSATKESAEWLRDGLGELEAYRFVRFLPDVIYAHQGELPPNKKLRSFADYRAGNRTVGFHYHASKQSAGVKIVEEDRHFDFNDKVWTYKSQSVGSDDLDCEGRMQLPSEDELRDALKKLPYLDHIYPEAMIKDLEKRTAFWAAGPKIWTRNGEETNKATLVCVFSRPPMHELERN